MEWSLRTLLNPVITRLLVYGVQPIDVEYVVAAVERQTFRSADGLQKAWFGQWEEKGRRYTELGEAAERNGYQNSAHAYFFLAAQCAYASFLITGATYEVKKASYQRFSELYARSMRFPEGRLLRVEVPLEGGAGLPGLLHLPAATKTQPVPCVVIFGGLGSCKEELHQLATPIVDRGVAAFVPDMPGSGEALFSRQLHCRMSLLSQAFTRIVDVLSRRTELIPGAVGAYGLCMGGGYAHRAACMDDRYRLCATLFPLHINQVTAGVTPRWMSHGDWTAYQSGGLRAEALCDELRPLEEGRLRVPFLLVHGRHDNWMKLEQAMAIFDAAEGPKEHLIIEEQPVFSAQEKVTHTMPVAEQLHWVRHHAADWVVSRLQAVAREESL